MRMMIHHPPQGGNEIHAKGPSHHDEMFLLMILMLGPVILSLPPVTLSALWKGSLWVLLGLIVATTIMSLLFLAYLVLSWPVKRKVQPMRAVAFQPEMVPEKLDTIVIGSGSGGSTTSSLLAQSGQRVLVLEQHPTVTGGCTHSFREQNCEWDTGLHYTSKAMGQPTARSGAIMDFASHGFQEWTALEDPYDEIVFPADNHVKKGAPNHKTYPFVSGGMETVDRIMERIDPDNETLRLRAMVYMDVCNDIHDGFTALGISRILPNSLQFLVQEKVDRLMKYATLTVRDVQHAVLALGYSKEKLLAEYQEIPKAPEGIEPDTSIRRLKAVLTHPIGDYAVQPREATMAAHGITMAHYMDGGSYTVGATQKISIRLTSMVRAYGGEVFVDATVRGIIVENGRAVGVRVSSTSALAECNSEEEKLLVPETEIFAKNVVCATSVYNLYNKLLPQDLPVVKRFQQPTERSIRQSNGHVFLFCKIKGDPDELDLPKHNLWYFNGYGIDEAFDSYMHQPCQVRPPTVYIGFPCTKDTKWKRRFPGISNCIMISDGQYEWFEKWKNMPPRHRAPEYEAFKEELRVHLMDILLEAVPQVRDKVEFYHLGTPLTEVTYLSSYRGGSYGTFCNQEMFKPINRKWTTTPHTSVPGLFLSGSDAFLPSVVGAMYGGSLGACAVLGHIGTLRLSFALLSNLSRRLREDDPKLTWVRSLYVAVKKFTSNE
ncbi:All-trans-retinol 13,14-reductase [Seminavis robusta]|uniref:All-trans-retinol 13,14-reductase n=1 Tax=Seminavis robusta TaxID=568900 RepID=A0A9N8DW49_9STRA|nr:All-trans-retinol 13,14-reductase [Seminavis robusta]|eukprot:Sro325_g117800.1 All-trans-retinol 13,14-reductase (715) ;mRNA; r:39249-41926